MTTQTNAEDTNDRVKRIVGSTDAPHRSLYSEWTTPACPDHGNGCGPECDEERMAEAD